MAECPLWVINGLFSTIPKMSAFGGKADIECGNLIHRKGRETPSPDYYMITRQEQGLSRL